VIACAGQRVWAQADQAAQAAQATQAKPASQAARAVARPALTVFSAGSMSGALSAIATRYTADHGQKIDIVAGPAGLLRERIEGGAHADIFISANMAHPQQLSDAGKAGPTVVFARNRICVQTRPELGLNSANLLDKLLDPAVKIGTSTPKADPGGDYAWLLFARADKVKPGAGKILEAKAQQLVGGRTAPAVPAGRNPVDYFMETRQVDVFIGYCSSHSPQRETSSNLVELPADLAIDADYGMTVLEGAGDASMREAAYRFALYLMSPQAQALLTQYGFRPVALQSSR
jgi:molybdate transport system substrate-binding protein